jgi:hypothetical protein
MSQVKVQGNVSGTGIFTIESPNSNNNRTMTLPDASGALFVNPNNALDINPGAPASSLTISATGVLGGAGTSLTALNASNLSTGTVPDARFPATLPAASGANLTSLNASNLSSGTVATARLGSGTANSTTFLRGDNTWATAGGVPAFDDIGSLGVFWFTSGTDTTAGTNVSGSNLFRATTGNWAPFGSSFMNLNANDVFGVAGNIVGRTTSISGGARTAAPVSGTWRLLCFGMRAYFNGCLNATIFPALLAVRVA